MVRCSSLASVVVLAALSAGCGVRAPGPLDVNALIRERGPVEARRELEVRILDEPRDVQARLALAKLADETKRPSQALEQLEAVLKLGGPIGTRWHDEDRSRIARLLAARGRDRLERGAPKALEDLERARSFGAKVEAPELLRARAAIALAALRHVDAKERVRGRLILAELASTEIADPSWFGAKPEPVPRDRGLFGIWLWERGARRAAYEVLRDWFQTASVKDGPLLDAYRRADAWWTPVDAPAPIARTSDPAEVAAWTVLALQQALRGEGGWGSSLAAHVEVTAIELASLPPFVRAAFARLTGGTAPSVDDAELAGLRPQERLVVAATKVLDGATSSQVRAALGPAGDTPEGRALLGIVEPMPASTDPDAFAAALTAYVGSAPAPTSAAALTAIVAAYRRDPGAADRLASDFVASATDAAAAQATIGALFESLADPARARLAWEQAVALSPEPAFVHGLASAAARANDPDAAMIYGTKAAAAAGDPAVVWLDLSRILEGVGKHVHAIEAARYAIDLAGTDLAGDAYDAAITASRSLGRASQADALLARRARLAPARGAARPDDPTDATSALAAARRDAGASAIARLWVASRWNPRNVEVRAALLDAIATDDPRRGTLTSELVDLAGDRDPATARAAVAALR